MDSPGRRDVGVTALIVRVGQREGAAQPDVEPHLVLLLRADRLVLTGVDAQNQPWAANLSSTS